MRFLSVPAIALCGLILLVAVVGNWPCYYSDTISTSTGAVSNTLVGARNSTGEGPHPVRFQFGGWPLKYYIASEFKDRPTVAYFSLWPLLGNVLCFVTVTALLIIYEARAERAFRRSVTAVSSKRRRNLSLQDLVLLLSILALIFAYWQALGMRTSEQGRTVAGAAGKMMQVTFSALQPDWLHLRMKGTDVDSAISNRCLRARDVVLDHPDDAAVKLALSFDTLQSLSIGGGEFDLRLLDKLPRMPMLHSLRISGRTLDAAAIAAIGSCKQLQSLDLMRTNITAEGVKALGEMPRLRSLCLTHTDVKLRELKEMPISKSVTDLYLPHPNVGESDRLELADWPELETLHIVEYETLSNSEPVEVVLRRLPKLRRLALDRFQQFDVTLEQIPNLQAIDVIAYQSTLRFKRNDQPGAHAWLRKLVIRESSLKEKLVVQSHSLKLLDIQTKLPVCLQLNHTPTTAQPAVINSPDPAMPDLMNQLGKCSGITELDFSGQSLIKTDIAPLRNIASLVRLNLSATQCNADDLRKLAGAKLRELNLAGVPLLPETVTELCRDLPELERLTVNDFRFEVTPLRNTKLKEIGGNQNAILQSRLQASGGMLSGGQFSATYGNAVLVNLPNFTTEVNYYVPLASVQIQNIPRVSHLVFYYPLPAESTIEGLEDLKLFGAGGSQLTDRHCRELLRSKRLTTLSLLYSGISSETLKELNQLTALGALYLSGSAVTDEVIAAWKDLKNLVTLKLDDTQITGASLKLIANQFPQLSSLTINVPASEQQLMALAGCKGINELAIKNNVITVGLLNELAKLKYLGRLDLSRCQLDAEAVDLLVSGLPNVKAITLVDVQLSKESLRLLSKAGQDKEIVFGSSAPRRNAMQIGGSRVIETRVNPGELPPQPFQSER